MASGHRLTLIQDRLSCVTMFFVESTSGVLDLEFSRKEPAMTKQSTRLNLIALVYIFGSLACSESVPEGPPMIVA